MNHPEFPSFNITALVRSPEKAEKLKKLGVNAVVGSHTNDKVTSDLAAENDVVIAMVRLHLHPKSGSRNETSPAGRPLPYHRQTQTALKLLKPS